MSDERAPLDELQAERLARYRTGRAPAAEREAFEREVLADDALASALYDEESLDIALRRRARPAPAWWGLAMAAALLAVAGSLWWMQGARESGPTPPVRRGEAAVVRLLEPAGPLAAAPERFTWTRDAGAASYRFELRDADGRLLATSVVRDTSVSAAALGLEPPPAGSWSVVPISPLGEERAAPPPARFGPARR